jgi:hypothetical protein
MPFLLAKIGSEVSIDARVDSQQMLERPSTYTKGSEHQTCTFGTKVRVRRQAL